MTEDEATQRARTTSDGPWPRRRRTDADPTAVRVHSMLDPTDNGLQGRYEVSWSDLARRSAEGNRNAEFVDAL